MQHKAGIGNRINRKQAVPAFRPNAIGEFGQGLLTPDDTADDDMRDMDAARPEFPCKALRHRTQRRYNGAHSFLQKRRARPAPSPTPAARAVPWVK
jgi:hypothetical protein